MKLFVLLQTITLLGLFFYPQITLADDAPDVDKDLMYFIEETNDKLRSDLALKRKEDSIESADMMIELTQMVEEHFTIWAKNEKATQLAKTSQQNAIDIAKLVRVNKFDEAIQKGIELSNNCESCHQLF
jgi:hypothetical protein